MNSVALLCGLLLSAAPKPAVNDEAAKFEGATDTKPRLKLVTDGKGHYLAMDTAGGYKGPFFYGDEKNLYLVRSPGGGAVGDTQFDISLWDPRVDWRVNGYARFGLKDGAYTVTCPPKTVTMTVVPPDEAKKLIDAASLYEMRWMRRPHKLARDDKGNYYFVDCARDERSGGSCERDWRLYVGTRGKMKLQQMTNIVSDSVGQIFSTRSGELRLVLNDEERPADDGAKKEKKLKWVNGKEVTALVDVPVEQNARMIYMDLGVYDREKLGTPCDDI